MSVYISHFCADCGERVVNDDKRRAYVHHSFKFGGVAESHPVSKIRIVKG